MSITPERSCGGRASGTHEGAAPDLAADQAAAFRFGIGPAHCADRHTEAICQVAMGRQTIARTDLPVAHIDRKCFRNRQIARSLELLYFRSPHCHGDNVLIDFILRQDIMASIATLNRTSRNPQQIVTMETLNVWIQIRAQRLSTEHRRAAVRHRNVRSPRGSHGRSGAIAVGSVLLSARLDDRMLRDIGLTLADVEGEVTKPFWK
jgi:hypothetical protein